MGGVRLVVDLATIGDGGGEGGGGKDCKDGHIDVDIQNDGRTFFEDLTPPPPLHHICF